MATDTYTPDFGSAMPTELPPQVVRVPATLDDVVARLDRLTEQMDTLLYNVDCYMQWWRNR